MFQALARSPPKSVVLSTDVTIDDQKTHSVNGWFSRFFQLRGVSPEASDPLNRLGSVEQVRGGVYRNLWQAETDSSEPRFPVIFL